MKLAILLVLTGLCYGQEFEPQQKPLSVCEVLERRVELMGVTVNLRGEAKPGHMGRIVSVRGEVKFGGHGPYLIAAPTCTFKLTSTSTTWPNGLTTPGATWPNVIHLEYPNNEAPDESFHAPFELDWASVRRADGQVALQGCCSESDQLFETFTGLLVSFDELELPRASQAAPILKRRGFGPAGLDALAKLLIKSVADPVVIRKPKK